MAVFAYRAYRSDGSTEEGRLQAESADDALRSLARLGKKPFSFAQLDGSASTHGQRLGFLRLEHRRLPNITKFLADMAPLLQAGFHVDAALRIVAKAESNGAHGKWLTEVAGRLSEGRSLSEALISTPSFPGDVAAAISSGENSGKLDLVFVRLAAVYANRAKRRAEIRDALAYPIFVVLMFVCAVLVLTFFLVPALQPVFETSKVDVPLVIAALANVRTALSEYPHILLSSFAAGCASILVLARSGLMGRLIDRGIFRLPLIGHVIKDASAVRYLDTLGLLLGNGVPVSDALRLSADTCSRLVLKKRLLTAREQVTEGKPLHLALASTGMFDRAVIMLLELGEDSNTLPALVTRASVLVEARMKRSLDRFLVFLTPLITIVLGVLIGSLVLSVMSALLSINEIAVR